MKTHGIFPFGQPVLEVIQKDRSTKPVFILGVYASAVHARWVGPHGRTLVKALAVASEPEIFWCGDNTEEVISKITVPIELGTLQLPSDKRLNGPSGNVLKTKILDRLELKRDQVWFCDLIPYSRMNENQMAAIERAYEPKIISYGLPKPTMEKEKDSFDYEGRREEILSELKIAKAHTLILLGDEPIYHFLYPIIKQWKKLSDFGDSFSRYGRPHRVNILGQEMNVLALAHPRQIGQLGKSSAKWRKLHEHWLSFNTPSLLEYSRLVR